LGTRANNRQQGRVRTLLPGGRWEARLAVEVFTGAAGVAGIQTEIARLQAHARAQIHRTPQPRFSAS